MEYIVIFNHLAGFRMWLYTCGADSMTKRQLSLYNAIHADIISTIFLDTSAVCFIYLLYTGYLKI